jgi:hypothetical protein
VATRVSGGHARYGLVVAALLLIATIANLRALPHPTWLWAAAILLIPAAGWTVSRASARPITT